MGADHRKDRSRIDSLRKKRRCFVAKFRTVPDKWPDEASHTIRASAKVGRLLRRKLRAGMPRRRRATANDRVDNPESAGSPRSLCATRETHPVLFVDGRPVPAGGHAAVDALPPHKKSERCYPRSRTGWHWARNLAARARRRKVAAVTRKCGATKAGSQRIRPDNRDLLLTMRVHSQRDVLHPVILRI
jgi:hypothetical protein